MYKYENIKADSRYEEWISDLKKVPFKFSYRGEEYCGFSFPLKCKKIDRIDTKEVGRYEFTVDDTLEVTLLLTHYYDYGATEFTVWFENVGDEDSGIIEDPRMDMRFEGENAYIRGIKGDHQNQYAAYEKPLTTEYVESKQGRATHFNFPYFNVEHGDGGTILVIGWAGRWETMMENTGDGFRYIARYAMPIKTYLKAKEKIRTPLFLIAPYTVRNEYYATNYWRSWFMKYNMPKADAEGNELKPFSTCTIAGDTGIPNSDGSISENKNSWKPSLEKLFQENIHFDYRWFDAGYFPAPSGTSEDSYWGMVGAWVLDEQKWGKDGVHFKESVEYAHANGVKTLMWVEPERVTEIDSLVENYGYKKEWAIPRFPDYYPFGYAYIMNNISNPECYEWTKNRVFKLLKDNKIDLYREDYNLYNPGECWVLQDQKEGADRYGITECKAVAAHYRLWEEMIEWTSSYGGCAFVDSCASGGGRNDLQSLRYGVPILRSDADRATTALRLSMSTSFNKWIPFHGACHLEKLPEKETEQDGISDVYTWRASYLPIMNILGGRFSQDKNYDFDMLRFGLAEWKKVNPYLTKDFYPLTPWKDKNNKSGFTAHCYIDADKDEGVMLAYRMEECDEDTLALELPFAENAEYQFIDEDSKKIIYAKDKKLTLTFAHVRQARLLWVKKAVY